MGMLIEEKLVYVGTVSSGVSRFLLSKTAAESVKEREESPFDTGVGAKPS